MGQWIYIVSHGNVNNDSNLFLGIKGEMGVMGTPGSQGPPGPIGSPGLPGAKGKNYLLSE